MTLGPNGPFLLPSPASRLVPEFWRTLSWRAVVQLHTSYACVRLRHRSRGLAQYMRSGESGSTRPGFWPCRMVQAGASYVVVILWLAVGRRSMQQGAGLAATNRNRDVGQRPAKRRPANFFNRSDCDRSAIR
jgi:hypothetical protein